MKRVHFERVLVLFTLVLLWLGIALVLVPKAHSQASGSISTGRQETTVTGRYKDMWNATGVEILDGTVVMIDTVAATSGPQIPLGKGFRTWDASSVNGNFYKIVGILVGNTPSFSKGRVLVEGLHPNALMDASGITAFTRLRPSLTTAGALGSFAAADTLVNQIKVPVGIFQRYANSTTTRGMVYVDFAGILGR